MRKDLAKIKAGPPRPASRKAYLFVTLFALVLVLFPFLFWYSTWFGRRLSDRELEQYLNDPGKPRHAQHALVQIGERISRGDRSVPRWYPKVIELASSPILELRQTAAWIMGQDHAYAPFHEALRNLLRDPEPMVRRNAALSLASFGDASARPELLSMLRLYTIRSPAAGRLKYRLKTGEYVNPGTLLARAGNQDVRSPLPGEVRELTRTDGAWVKPGDPVAEISADKEHVWEALRALALVGTPDDLDEVSRYARGVPGMPDRVRQQAALTMQAIRSRKPEARSRSAADCAR